MQTRYYNRKLIIKISAAIVVSVLVVNCAIFLSVYSRTKEDVLQKALNEAKIYASVLKPRLSSELVTHTIEYVHQTLGSVYRTGNIKELSIYNKNGKLVLSSAPVARKGTLIPREVSYVLTSGKETAAYSSDDNELKLYQPIDVKQYGTYGAICVGLKDINASGVAWARTMKLMAFATAAVLSLAIIIFFIVKFFLNDAIDKITAQVYRLESDDASSYEMDFHHFGYFFNVVFRISHLIKDLRGEIKKQNTDISNFKNISAKQEEFLKLAYKDFIPKSYKSNRLDLEVKFLPFSDKYNDFAFIYPFDTNIYVVMGQIGINGVESILTTSAIGNIIKENTIERRSPREVHNEIMKTVRNTGVNIPVNLATVIFDLKTNRLRHYGNLPSPIVLWKKNEKSLLLLKTQAKEVERDDGSDVPVEGVVFLAGGDKLILFNQSLIDIENKAGSRLGLEKFMDILSKNIESTSQNLRDIITMEVNKFSEGSSLDDVLFMIAEYKNAPLIIEEAQADISKLKNKDTSFI